MECVVDPDLEGALNTAIRALDSAVEAGVTPADHKDAARLIRRVEQLGRKVDSVRNDVLTAIDDKLLYTNDGHYSAKIMVRHVGRLSFAEAASRAAVSKALTQMPELAEAYQRGEVGSCQVRCLARVFANKRVREQLIADQKRFIDLAKYKPYLTFKRRVADWVRLTDEDGTADNSQARHENRDLRLSQEFDLGWNVSGRCGSIQGAQFEEILAAFIDAEFKADWAAAREEHGPDVTITKDMLARTDAQRRWDAWMKIALKAAETKGGGNQPGFITNIVIDHVTFERELAKIFGGTAAEPPDPWDPSFKCRTLNGRPIDVTEAAAAALVGKARRLVIDSSSTVIDVGRTRRFFTGNTRLAVQAVQTECGWPGCHVPNTACQIDHTVAWAEQPDGTGGSGCTCPANGGSFCGRHNRLKQTGYAVHRDEHGHWHTHRPDGTEIDP